MRLHYAHSLSVGVVIAVFQHIFFTGALSVNWPSVLVAWWSNFAWAGGMIYSSSMQNSINRLIGNDIGNTSEVGAAASDTQQSSVAGGFDVSQIYQRALSSRSALPVNHPLRRDLGPEIFKPSNSLTPTRDLVQRHVERALQARDALVDKSDGYRWYGHPVGSGLPLPGNYSGFAGTLGEQGIRVSNAFMTGFLWFLILLVLLVAAVIGFKWALEGLVRAKAIKPDRLKFFRDHWRRYTTGVALRTCYIAFFLIMFLTIFEFTYQSSAGVKAVAAVVFFIFIVGVPSIAAYAIYYKRAFASNGTDSGRHDVEHKKLLGTIPWAGWKKATQSDSREPTSDRAANEKSSKIFWKRKSTADSLMRNPDDVDNIHDHDDYTMTFGWLTARFRRTRWWFFAVWLFYEFLRAVFYAGASGYALAQVFGLLIIEFIAFAYIIWARPFEGRRLNIIVVYCLGFSKVASVALSAAFDIHFNLPRITTTVIGIVIVIIQGVLTIITMIAMVVGAISSYMSVSRNHEDFRPRKWHGLREKYFNHLDRVVNDLPREPKPKKADKVAPLEPEAGFEMKGVRRLAKIEDEDEDFASEMRTQEPNASYLSLDNRGASPVNPSDSALAGRDGGRRSRPASIQSQSNLPYGARLHRPSWHSRDFSPAAMENDERAFTPVDMSRDVPEDEPEPPPVPALPTKSRLSRSGSLSSAFNKRASVQTARQSTESLHIGGEVSTRDTIGNVPAPAIRPRSGTYGSNRNSRVGTPVNGLDGVGDNDDSHPVSHRNSKYMLTPAQERDEWGTPKQFQDESG